MEPLVIALAPDLEVAASKFVAAWNRTLACRSLAQAESAAGTAVGDRVVEERPILLADALVVLRPTAAEATAGQIQDLVNKALISLLPASKPIEILEDHEPEEVRIMIVHARDTRL